MIRARYNRKSSVYTVQMTQTNLGDAEFILLKFDTGAVVTIIGVRALFNAITEDQRGTLEQYFLEAGIEAQEFYSATGHSMMGFPCAFNQIRLSGEMIEWFPFYLVLDTDRKVALIGNDFITHCKFHHDPNGDIEVESFDKEEIKTAFLQAHPKTFEINQILK